MNKKNITARAAAAIAFGLMASVPAAAQTTAPVGAPALSFGRPVRGDSSHTLLLVSAIVLVVGLAESNSTLTILGGAGVLISLSETGRLYRPESPRRGVDLVKVGRVSMGVSPFGQIGQPQGFSSPQPSAYVRITTKF
ncbi:MAG: hypothetical protein HYR64_02260 [Fimbriimonas ginsengisoli]|uniref:Secreted protein n=1 Tax=Fimbriimonas ginsengisoli TaxID=1005039 RepID=A0A931LTL6_FIMGI|nr:hypothetical protein [Fimbriimonas ginsengisoli]